MTASPDSHELSTQPPYNEAEVDRLVDTNSVSSYQEAFHKLGIEIPMSETAVIESIATAIEKPQEDVASTEPHAVTPERKKRSARVKISGKEPRHGDSEMDGGIPQYFLPYEAPSPEAAETAREAARRGIAQVMRATAVRRYDRLKEDAARLGIPEAALLRAREEKRNRERPQQ